MQSSNPVFRRAEGFNGKSASGMSYPAYGGQPSGGSISTSAVAATSPTAIRPSWTRPRLGSFLGSFRPVAKRTVNGS